jgi:hypothetical protein
LPAAAKCNKTVTVPKSVKIVGPHISCPPSFVYGKELASVEAGPKDVLCTYGDSLKCFYNPKTGKKMGKSSKGASLNWVAGCGSSWPGCPASTAKSTGCGSLCYTGCPAKTDSGAKWDGMDLFWENDPADGDGSSILLSCCNPFLSGVSRAALIREQRTASRAATTTSKPATRPSTKTTMPTARPSLRPSQSTACFASRRQVPWRQRYGPTDTFSSSQRFPS